MSEVDRHGERILRPLHYRWAEDEARRLGAEFETLRLTQFPRAAVVWIPDDISTVQPKPWTYKAGGTSLEVLQTEFVEGLPPFIEATLHASGFNVITRQELEFERFFGCLHILDEMEDSMNPWQIHAQINSKLDSTILQRCASLLREAIRIKWLEVVPEDCWSQRYNEYGDPHSTTTVNWFSFVCCLSDYGYIPNGGYSGRCSAAAGRVQDHWQIERYPQIRGTWSTVMPRYVAFQKFYNSRPWFTCYWEDFFLASTLACRFLESHFARVPLAATPESYSPANDQLQTVQGACESSSLVSIEDVAKLVHLEPTSMTRYVKQWPSPRVSHRGRRKAIWDLELLRPVLQEQFPHVDWDAI